jgi:RimJ/RimL family protein N-acetyltransferase
MTVAREWLTPVLDSGSGEFSDPVGFGRVQPIPLSGRRVRLRAVVASDYDFLFVLATDPRTAPSWRYRSAPPRPEEFVRDLWHNVLVQYLVEHVDTGERLGLVVAYNANGRDGHCYFSALFRPDMRVWPLEGLGLFVNYLFTEFDFIKLYAEVIEYNLPAFASAIGRWLTTEGVLRAHERHFGRHWDVHLLTLWRERFEQDRQRFLRRVTATPRP